MKKLINVILVFVLSINAFVFPVYAGEPLTLDTAKKLAVENARSLKSMKLGIEQLKIKAKIAEDTYLGKDPYEGWQNTVNYLYVLEEEINELNAQLANPDLTSEEIETLNTKLQNKMAMKQAQEALAIEYKNKMPSARGTSTDLKMGKDKAKNAYSDMKKSYEDSIKQLEVSVEKLYYGLLYQKDAIDNLHKTIDVQSLNLRVVRIKRELGMATQLDELIASNSVIELTKKLSDMKAAYKLSVWKLNDLIGRDINEKIELVAPNYTPVYEYASFDSVLDKCMEKNTIITNKERDLELIADQYTETKDEDTKELLSVDIEKAKIEILNAKQQIKDTVKSLVDNANTKFEAWSNAEINRRKAAATYESDKKKYELGLIPLMQLKSSDAAYNQAFADERKAAYDYSVAVHEVKLAEEGIISIITQ